MEFRTLWNAFFSLLIANDNINNAVSFLQSNNCCNQNLGKPTSNLLVGTKRKYHIPAPYVLVESSRQDIEKDESHRRRRKSSYACTHCGKTFETRNALFRHLRNDPVCSNIDGKGSTSSSTSSIDTTFQKDSVAILFGYDAHQQEEETFDSFVSHSSDAEIVSRKILDAFDFALQRNFGQKDIDVFSQTFEDKRRGKEFGVISSTQVSIAKLRVQSLSQENGICAAGDVMTLSYRYPVKQTFLDESKNFQDEFRSELLQILKKYAIEFIDSKQSSHENINAMQKIDGSDISNVRILGVKLLPRDSRFHAERSCTQRGYHYLLPIKWIDGGDQIEKWWLENQDEVADTTMQSNSENAKFGIKGQKRLSTPPPKQLTAFKKILKSFESKEKAMIESNENDGYKEISELSQKRFGTLAKKSFRAWHNFADPTIRGTAASPNNKTVWRALDRCRIVYIGTYHDLHDFSKKDKVMVIVELRGDDFIQQQARRIIGSAVAIANGWLPLNFAEIATSPDVLIETPIAPLSHIYQTRPRFHYDELINSGRNIFEKEFDNKLEAEFTSELHDRILQKFTKQKPFTNYEWLNSLKNKVTPRLREKIKQLNAETNGMELRLSSSHLAPAKYIKSLQLLQDIVSCGKWPATSSARSRVIKDKKNLTETQQNGSFTVINPKYMDGILMENNQTEVKVPLGNTLFPDLVDAVFQLEDLLAQELAEKDQDRTSRKRLPSSHCAINCNAQFTPHVDSGRGCGQSLSMIVGLGAYQGGNLCVEDDTFDICYKPKQFDGWRDRHWTEPFQGQRFSLVWFTPEMKGVND